VANLAGGEVLDVTGKAAFSVSNPELATVSASGELRALAPGDCGLTALVGSVSAKLNTHIRARADVIARLEIRGKVELDLGEKTQLQAIATLDTGAEVDVTAKASFSSSNDAVLRVSASGLLEAIGEGTCDVLSLIDGIKASAKVHVRGRVDPGTHITRIAIRGKVNLDLGDKTQLQAIATLNSGAELDVTANAVFRSSNDAVLRVSAAGFVEAVGIGATVIAVTVDGIKGSEDANVRLGAIARLDIGGASDLTIGERATVRVMATTANGVQADVTSQTELSTSNPLVLKVNAGGVIEAFGPGSCDLIALHGGVRAMLRLNVTLKPAAIVRLRIDGASSLQVGETALLKVIAGMSDNTEVDVTARVNWASSTGGCGLSLGILTALAPGDCLITVALDGIKATLAVHVKASAATIVKLRIEGLTMLRLLQTTQLKAIATMSDDTEVDVTGRVAWSTGNALLARVNVSGLLTALLPGDCLITGVIDGVQASVTVKVTL
jgi:hypothetical protein